MFHSVSLLSQAPLAHGSCALPSVLLYMLLSVILEMAKLRSASPREITSPFPHAIISKLCSKTCNYLYKLNEVFVALLRDSPLFFVQVKIAYFMEDFDYIIKIHESTVCLHHSLSIISESLLLD